MTQHKLSTSGAQGLVLSPTGEAWFAPEPGQGLAYPLNPPWVRMPTTNGQGRPTLRFIYRRDAPALLVESARLPMPEYITPMQWALPIPLAGDLPKLTLDASAYEMPEIRELVDRLLRLSLQCPESAQYSASIQVTKTAALFDVNQLSRQNIGPTVLLGSKFEHLGFLKKLPLMPLRVPVLSITWDRLMPPLAGYTKVTFEELWNELDQITSRSGLTLEQYGARMLTWWAMRRYESLQFGLETVNNPLQPW